MHMAFREYPDRSHAFLTGGGEMGARIRAFDWRATGLGEPRGWPASLKTALRIMLASRQPMWVWWGPELLNFYNDAYLSIIGGKHPAALGQPARQVWAEIWPQIKDRIEAAMVGESSYSEAELLVMHRNGYPEETYYTFSFSPVPDENDRIGGLVCANSDDTERVIGVRRMALLRDLAMRGLDAARTEDVYRLAAESLATDDRDIPFAAFYRFAEDGECALLAGCSGIAPGHAAAPEVISAEAPHVWPVAGVARTGRMQVVSGLSELFSALPSGPWPESPREALVLPLSAGADSAARGVLVLGITPYRLRDGGLEDFARMIARQIASALLNVEAFEVERERARGADALALEVEHRRRIERQQNLLLDELNHRVKNTLATVQALAIQTLKGTDAPARDAFIGRLFALSGQHDLLTLGNWEGASLEGVVRRALKPWREESRAEGHERFLVEGPPVNLNTKRALALGMAFHELATNAARHGAFSVPDGKVRVSWRFLDDGNRLRLDWCESGGPRIAAPGPKGFGLRLVEMGLAREISGAVELAFPPEGLTCSWEMTLP
jgi:two-component sensor histidine kinase